MKNLPTKWMCAKCGMTLTQNHSCFVCGNTDKFVLKKIIKKTTTKFQGGVTIKINV